MKCARSLGPDPSGLGIDGGDGDCSVAGYTRSRRRGTYEPPRPGERKLALEIPPRALTDQHINRLADLTDVYRRMAGGG